MKNSKIKLTLLVFLMLVILIMSFLYEPLLEKIITTRITSIKGKDGIRFPPFTPTEVFPFGTDLVGFTILSKLIQGFKYTFTIVFLLSFFQLTIGFFLSFYSFKLSKTSTIMYIINYLDKILTLVPKPFLLILLIMPFYSTIFLNETPDNNLNQQLLLQQLIILLLISLPNLIKLFQSELVYLFETDYAKASFILGSNSYRMIFFSLRPQLSILFFSLFFKTITQNLALFIYYAYFQFFLGGTLEIQLDRGSTYILPLSNEWSGIIGQNIRYLHATPWTLLIPMLAYCFLIFIIGQINLTLKLILVGDEYNESL